jgi:NADPH-dependent 2,4-dienoyl-CoA reductase/sulfur reductase-like enzyme/nitrite reductase/ring-hydroxylating ferredoxin subunit
MEETGWRRVARESDLTENALVVVVQGEEKILLTRIQGNVYAVGHECPHYQEKLEKGALFGTQIICKSHFARMDVTTGRVIAPPAFNDLPIYAVKIENGEVWIGEAAKPKFPKPPAALGSDARIFLIAGAGAAGSMAAETLRRQGFAGKVVMVTGESERPYDRPNLSKDFITGKAGEEWLPLRGPKFYSAQGIELLTGRKIVSLDTQNKIVTLEGGESIAFNKALLATGGNPRKLLIPGADGEGCYTLRTTIDARAIVAAASQWKSVLLVGAGFIGLELAGSLRDRGLEVTVIAPESVPLAHILGDRVGAYVKSLHEAREVRLLMGRTPARIEGAVGAKTVVLSDGARLTAGFIVIGLGIVPAVEYLSGTGLVENGAVPVDDGMRTRAPDIFAAGDIAALPDVEAERRRAEHWVVAQRQGQRAALGMLGRNPGPMEIDFFWSRQAGMSLKYVGHAHEFDQTVYRGVVEEGSFLVGYFRKGVLKAAATIGMALDLLAVERLLWLGNAPSAAQIADPTFDLMAAASQVNGS